MVPIVLAVMMVIGKRAWIEPDDVTLLRDFTPVDIRVTPDTHICSSYTFTTFFSHFHLQPLSCVHDDNLSFTQHHQKTSFYVRTFDVFDHPCMLEGWHFISQETIKNSNRSSSKFAKYCPCSPDVEMSANPSTATSMRLHICLCKVQEKLPAEVTLFVQQRTRNMLYVRHVYLLKLPFQTCLHWLQQDKIAMENRKLDNFLYVCLIQFHG